jgi:hypothetical protein
LVSLLVQSPILNIQNPIYPSTLSNVVCKKLVIALIYVPFIENIMEQNLVGFPNSMYPCVGPYTPYFGFGYRAIKSVLIMLPLVFDPLAKPMASPKLVSEIT